MFFAQIGERWRTERDPAWGWGRKAGDSTRIELSAHEWMGRVWHHEILVVRPTWESGLTGCYLEVTGDDAGEVDVAYARDLAEFSGLPVAVFFQVPNQPLWEMIEDDLIAHTFEQYLNSGDDGWPLLVPMVRSVLAAMDALGEAEGFDRFVVGGASKRGWTSWLTAATGDERVRGIVPVVFDNLRMDLQMQRQMQMWGRPSEMVDDYVRRQLHMIANSPLGQDLVERVDPWWHLEGIDCPALVVNGANDAYWAVDALGVYYNKLPEGSGAVVVPNLGHSTGGRQFWCPALYRFASSVLGGGEFPVVEAAWEGATLRYSTSCEPSAMKVWVADSETLGFWDVGWQKTLDFERGEGVLKVESGEGRYRAALVEFEFSDEDGFWRLTSPAGIVTGG